jgi:hypothetical protein
MLPGAAAVLWVTAQVYPLVFKIFDIGHNFPLSSTCRKIIGVYFESHANNVRPGDAGAVFRSEFLTCAFLWISAYELPRSVRLKRDWWQYFFEMYISAYVFDCTDSFSPVGQFSPKIPLLLRLNLLLIAHFSNAFLTIHKIHGPKIYAINCYCLPCISSLLRVASQRVFHVIIWWHLIRS